MRRFQRIWLTMAALCTGLGMCGLAREERLLNPGVTFEGFTRYEFAGRVHVEGQPMNSTVTTHDRLVYVAGVFVVAVVGLAVVLVWTSLRRERAAQREAQVALMVHEIRTRLVQDEAVVILHARDEWCPGDMAMWAVVEQRMGNDSRVRVTKQLIAGEVQRVWRWLARTTPLTPLTPAPAPVAQLDKTLPPQPEPLYPTVPDMDS